MSLIFESWPFLPSEARSLEETERWWAGCYQSSTAQVIVSGRPHWRVIIGEPGSGKSIALAAFERQARGHAMILRYSTENWPGARMALKKGGNHLSQIMALASLAIRRDASITLDRVQSLHKFQIEYLRWLLDKFGGARAYARWIGSIGGNPNDAALDVPFEDRYTTETEYLDAQEQVADLIDLVRHWGYQRVLIIVDVDNILTDSQINLTGDLFGWLELMHHDGLEMIAAVPTHVFHKANVRFKARGRISLTQLTWSAKEKRAVVNRHLQVATGGQVQTIDQLAKPALIEKFENIFKPESETAPVSDWIPLKNWIGLTETLLGFASRHNMPLDLDRLDEIKRDYFAKHMQLRMDPAGQRGVWLGPRFVQLDEQPFVLLQAIYQKKGQPVLTEDLKRVVGSIGNVHTLVKRVREAIEPDPSNPIYLKNRKSEGYWLENLTPEAFL